jgi:hypothetical protein
MAQARRNRGNFDQNALLREIVFALLASVQKKPDLHKALKYLQRAEKKINGT